MNAINEVHVIADSSDEDDVSCATHSSSSSACAQVGENGVSISRIEDALEALQEMSELSRNLGTFLIESRTTILQKRVREVAAIAAQTKSKDHNSEPEPQQATPMDIIENAPAKRRRLSHDVRNTPRRIGSIAQEKFALIAKIQRMQRISMIIQNLEMSHELLKNEMEGLLSDVRQETYEEE